MVFFSVLMAALLIIITALQTTFPEDARVKTRQFKLVAIIVACLSGVLMIFVASSEGKAQKRLQAAMEGLSKTVFPQDIEFEFNGIYTPRPTRMGDFRDVAFITVYVIPEDSPLLCRWKATHTPTVAVGLGQFFTEYAEPPAEELFLVFKSSRAQLIRFPLSPPESGPMTEYSVTLRGVPVVMKQYISLDNYMESQFIAEITVPGTLHKIQYAALILKGKPVPFHMLPKGNHWVGSTVFRPTWERYCQGRK